MSSSQGGYAADHDLWAPIEAFSPDEPGVAFPFTARLAKENGWTREEARGVTREYLRFVYLAMTAGHPVTPSQAVDEAWHLHLTYTHSYWEELCGRVLGRPLHHEPTRGGADEEAKFGDWYARTLDSYRTAFGEEPPENVWPRPRAPVAEPARAATSYARFIDESARKRRRVAVFVGALITGIVVAVATGGGVGVIVGFISATLVLLIALAQPAMGANAYAGSHEQARRAATPSPVAGCSNFAMAAACGGGGSDSGPDAGCDSHAGCSGDSGCDGGSSCGSSGCGSSGCGGGGGE